MAEYSFNKPNVNKVYALDAALRNAPFYDWFTYESPNLTVGTTQELDSTQLANLQQIVDNYTDPAVFLSLSSTIPDTIRSKTTNSATPEVVQAFIYSNSFNGVGTFNAIKSVLEYATDDVQQFLNFSGTCSVTFEIYCYTRQLNICSFQIDITDICNSWKTMAENGETGPKAVYRTFQVEGLRHSVANYDCLWNYKLAVSNSDVNVTIHAKQMLYYDIL